MNTCIKNLFFLPALMTGLGLILAARVTAQTFTTLHAFSDSSDGAEPAVGLILSDNTLYGTANSGGRSGSGTVFKVNTDGTGFTTLHSFMAFDLLQGPTTNSDGADPVARLILSGNTLYGTALQGGDSGSGTLFAVNTDGTGFTNLHSFAIIPNAPPHTNSDGAYPAAGLILLGSTLYGTTYVGGSSGNGAVFAVNTDGSGFTNLHNFTAGSGSYPHITNSDGAWPDAELILSGSTLYGTALYGGNCGNGTVFAINTDGTGFTTLYSFTGFPDPGPPTNSDGAFPVAGLILSGNTLYGTAIGGGSSGEGTVFAVNTDGTGFTTLHSFSARPASDAGANSDGAVPYAGLTLSGDTLYGTASGGGSSGNGTVFAVNTDGTGFTNLHSFTATDLNAGTNNDGVYPVAALILSGNTLYGTAYHGGGVGWGTVFSLSLAVTPPQLTTILAGANIILTWPTNATEFTLQSTTNLGSSAVWTTVFPEPVVVNGQNTVTNPISGAQQFFRLTQ